MEPSNGEEKEKPTSEDLEKTPQKPLQTLPEEPSDLKSPDEVLTPTNLKADLAANEILLTWGPPQGLKGHQVSYEVEWKRTTDVAWSKAITKENRFLLKNLSAETDYDMKVSAYERAIEPPPPEEEPEEKEKKPFEKMTLFPEGSTVSQAGSELEAFTERTKEISKLLAEIERTLAFQKRINKGEKIPKHLESKLHLDVLKPVRRKNCPKRILLVISNEMFARSPQLSAATKVQSEITRLFERDWKVEGDHVRKIKNGTRATILNEIDKLRQRLDFDSHKMFICIILSYGTIEGFRTMDEEMIDYQEIFSMLNGANWLQFSEKPKFFFIDVHPVKIERTGQYPQDVHVNELAQDELEVTWQPPKSFSTTDLNYLVNCYSLSEQRIHTKTHEIIAKKTSCVLDKLQKDVTYKISVWSVQATTQKKRGLPTQTKYIIKEKVEEPQRFTAVSNSYDSITLYWPLPLEGRQPPYFAKYKEKSASNFKRTELLLDENVENQIHVLNFLLSNKEYVIRLFAGRSRILNEVTVKTLSKHQPRGLLLKHITPFEIQLSWDPPNISIRKTYKYIISYQSKNAPISTIETRKEEYTLTEMIPDVVYTIWVTADKDGVKGDPTDSLECHTPRCGPQNLQIDAHERDIRVYWDEAIVPADTESLNYRARLHNENMRPMEAEIITTPDAKYSYACYFRDLWTDTQYTLVITTVIDEGDWDPPTEMQIKTRRDPRTSDLEPHDNNFMVAYSSTLGMEVGEKRQGGIFLPVLFENLRDHYDSKNIVDIMDIVEEEVQNRSAVTGRIKKVVTVNSLLSRPKF